MGVKSLDCRQDGVKLGYGPRESWLFNTTIAWGVEDADAVLLGRRATRALRRRC